MAKKKDPEPTAVDDAEVELGDACVVLTVNDEKFRLEPVQVAYLARNLTRLSNDLHIHSNA